MKYRGFYVSYVVRHDLNRERKDGSTAVCDGWEYDVFADDNRAGEIDRFTAALGFELPDGSRECVEMFAREMVDIEYKEYCRAAYERRIKELVI